MCKGRLYGSEMARQTWMREGRVSLQTLRADIDYGEDYSMLCKVQGTGADSADLRSTRGQFAVSGGERTSCFVRAKRSG